MAFLNHWGGYASMGEAVSRFGVAGIPFAMERLLVKVKVLANPSVTALWSGVNICMIVPDGMQIILFQTSEANDVEQF